MKKSPIVWFSLIILILSSSFVFILSPVGAVDEYKFSSNIRVNDDTSSTGQATPGVAVTSNGIVGAVWMDGRDDNLKNDIYFSKSVDGGNIFGDGVDDTDVLVNDDSFSASQKSPAIATYNNNFYVVWTDSRGNFDHIYFSKSTGGGSSFSSNKRADDTPSNFNVGFSDIAVTSSGTICVVWQDNRDGNADIYYSESTNDGSSFSTSLRVDNTGTGTSDQKYPKIAIGGSGDKYVVWQDNRNGNNDIYFAHAGPITTDYWC
jgi:hypothetical protein